MYVDKIFKVISRAAFPVEQATKVEKSKGVLCACKRTDRFFD